MRYYRVPVSLQNKPCGVVKNGCFYPNGWYLIANELLTEAECRKRNASIERLEPVNIKRTDTYTFFGARFATR